MDLEKNILCLRKVDFTHEDLLFKWANDNEVRNWSFNKKAISIEDHKEWFMKKINNKNVLMLIFEFNHIPAGLVRFERNKNMAILNYMISNNFRGKKLATKMLKMAANEIKKNWNLIKLKAFTLPDNIPSIKSLERAGFILESSSEEKNCYLLIIN